MDVYIDGDLLLVGEADFSFSLSLVARYPCPHLMTVTSYESLDELKRIHGAEHMSARLAALASKGIGSVRFGVDATQLEHHFNNNDQQQHRFARVYFMFPHVGGKSNMRKNRALLAGFFDSCARIGGVREVFVALAAGQGGTSFEARADRRAAADSWTIAQVAQTHGSFLLTECERFDAERFVFYRSTGFRSQAKSFGVENALVHKFEPSLMRMGALGRHHVVEFFRTHARLLDERCHPCIELRDYLARLGHLVLDKVEYCLVQGNK